VTNVISCWRPCLDLGIVSLVSERIPQLVGRAVLVVSTMLAAVEVGRVGLGGSTTKTVVAIVATIAFMPLHLWHLSYGVRGERPPHSGPTLAVIAVIHLVALVVIGVPWCFMLAVLATSALVVLPTPWSLAALAACVLAPLVTTWAAPSGDVGTSSSAAYLMYAVLFRAAIQFAIVWLAAAAHQLAASRSALAADAVMEERVRLQREVRASLEQHLSGLRDASRRARAALGTPGVAQPLVALDGVIAQANDALGDLRAIVAENRAVHLESSADSTAMALVRSVRAGRSPIGRGLGPGRAWRIFASVHAVVLVFPLLMAVGGLGLDPARHAVLAALAWLASVAVLLPASLAVARGRQPSYPVARIAVLAVLSFGLLGSFGGAWETAGWIPAIAALLCLRGPVGVAMAIAALVGLVTYDALSWPTEPSTYTLVWSIAYMLTVSALAVAGVWASARLLSIVVDLEAARDTLAVHAARSERKRLSRDLHDVLGQSLTAISLKGDLARRLIDADRPAAGREIDELEAVAHSLAAEIEAVARNEREVAFATEADAAVDLLRLAGVDVAVDLQLDTIPADASAVLGWAIREGATNILRHADARSCTIHGDRQNGLIRLELVNDGASARRIDGTGLRNLADRLAELDGRAAGTAIDGGRFRLRIEVPA
jgi:signal transduction histidine kinase